jgi:hypothetical protein
MNEGMIAEGCATCTDAQRQVEGNAAMACWRGTGGRCAALSRLVSMSHPDRLLPCPQWRAFGPGWCYTSHAVALTQGQDLLYSLDDKIRALNPILRGWGQYFRISNAHRHCKKVDSYVYTKLVNFLRRKHKRRGKGFRAFPPSFFREAGLYQLHGTIVRVFRMPPGERGRKAE